MVTTGSGLLALEGGAFTVKVGPVTRGTTTRTLDYFLDAERALAAAPSLVWWSVQPWEVEVNDDAVR